ncbi:hypothetical protein SK128_014462 [Halocaridina rubra]|uniref:Uncharacterized protein n=1 Tax=Halocaridina rubra TaxID=373956 RepID=A0AAN9A1W2_HALRR
MDLGKVSGYGSFLDLRSPKLAQPLQPQPHTALPTEFPTISSSTSSSTSGTSHFSFGVSRSPLVTNA